jgi:hypothetical protein
VILFDEFLAIDANFSGFMRSSLASVAAKTDGDKLSKTKFRSHISVNICIPSHFDTWVELI